MKNQKEIQIRILEHVGVQVSSLGFRKKLSDQAFYKKTAFGKCCLHLSFVPHQNDLDVIADVAIRFDALEELIQLHLPDPFATEKEKRNRFSFGSEMGRIKGMGQQRWTILHGSDVERIGDEIVAEFKETGLLFIEKHSNLCEIYDAISAGSQEAALLNAIPEKLARNAIAMAYLCKRDDTAEVADRMVDYLSQIPNTDLDAILKLAEALLGRRSS